MWRLSIRIRVKSYLKGWLYWLASPWSAHKRHTTRTLLLQPPPLQVVVSWSLLFAPRWVSHSPVSCVVALLRLSRPHTRTHSVRCKEPNSSLVTDLSSCAAPRGSLRLYRLFRAKQENERQRRGRGRGRERRRRRRKREKKIDKLSYVGGQLASWWLSSLRSQLVVN